MKTLIKMLTAVLFLSWVSCDEDNPPTVNENPEYYLFTYQPLDNNPYGTGYGFYKIKPDTGSFTAEKLNDFYPRYGWADTYICFNKNGVCAFYCDDPLVPAAAQSKVAYFTPEAPGDVHFLPLPEKVTDYTWTISPQKPKVLSDGRIVVVMGIYTDYPYDDWHDEVVAVYDPATGLYDKSESVSGFIFEQPEKGSDTELGSLNYNNFALSPDESTVFLKATGWGVEGGSIHLDARYIVAYNLTTKQFSRVYYGDNDIFGATQNRVYFRSTAGKTAAVDYHTLQEYPSVDDYPYDYYTFSRLDEMMVKSWRGSGLGSMTWNGATYDWMHIINTDKLTSTTYAGLGGRAFFNKDESLIYFAASSDFYTNYASEFAVMRTPFISENPTPEQLFVMPKNFSTYFYYTDGKK